MDEIEERHIYRASIRLRNGKRIYAWQYGLKAFRIKVKPGEPPAQLELPNLSRGYQGGGYAPLSYLAKQAQPHRRALLRIACLHSKCIAAW